jgi:hypothetical protein
MKGGEFQPEGGKDMLQLNEKKKSDYVLYRCTGESFGQKIESANPAQLS